MYLSRVHHKPDAVDRHRSLGDVGRNDALAHAIRSVVEHFVLVLNGQGTVQREYYPVAVLLAVLLGRIDDRRDLVEAAHEDQQISLFSAFGMGSKILE